jgi:hypothetical protein
MNASMANEQGDAYVLTAVLLASMLFLPASLPALTGSRRRSASSSLVSSCWPGACTIWQHTRSSVPTGLQYATSSPDQSSCSNRAGLSACSSATAAMSAHYLRSTPFSTVTSGTSRCCIMHSCECSTFRASHADTHGISTITSSAKMGQL